MGKTIAQLGAEYAAAALVAADAKDALSKAVESIKGAQDNFDAAEVAYRKAIGVGGKNYHEPNLEVACVRITYDKLQAATAALELAKSQTF
jgi:hypothetical protein